MVQTELGSKSGRWAIRGIALGLILFGGLNAASYHFRTGSWENLLGPTVPTVNESVGFPRVFWEQGNTYGGLFISYLDLGWNLVVGLAVSIPFAVFAIWNREMLIRWEREFQESQSTIASGPKMQFSLTSLLIATTLCALIAAVTTAWAGTRELLWFVYLLGPATLIGISFMPRRLRWQERVVILSVLSVFVIGGAVWTGVIRGMDFEKVLLGIAVFWTPQGVFAAVGLMAYLFVRLSMRGQQSDSTAK